MQAIESFFFLAIVVLGLVGLIRLAKLIGKPLEVNVLQRWGAFLPGAQTSGNDFLLLVEHEIDGRSLRYRYERMSLDVPPSAKNRAGNSPAVKITFDQIYSCFVSYEMTGEDLHLACVFHRRNPLLYAIPFLGPLLAHSWESIYVHEKNKLLAFATEVMECVEQAKDMLVDNLDLEKSSVKVREASGKLGPL